METIGRPFSTVQSRALPWHTCPVCRAPVDHSTATAVYRSDEGTRREIEANKEPTWADWGYFTVEYRCECGEYLLAAGRYDVDVEYDNEDGQIDVRIFRPGWLSHWPPLLVTSERVPNPVRAALSRADPLFWIDLGACAIALRLAVEIFLDEQGVARVPTGGDQRPLSIEKRIDLFVSQVNDKLAAEQYETFLRASKFIANDGAHGNEAILEFHVKNAAGFVGRVLALRYPETDALLAAAANIAARHPSPRQKREAKAASGAQPKKTESDS